MQTDPNLTATDWLERAALAGSFACLMHCLALPLLIASLPALSTMLSIPESFHIWVLAFAAPAAALALLQGRQKHGAVYPLVLGVIGLVLLATGALLLGRTADEVPVTVAGSLVLGLAHMANWRLRHTYNH